MAAARTSSCRLLLSAAEFSELLTVSSLGVLPLMNHHSPCRKTSLIEMIAGLRPLTQGSRDIGETTNIGYFTQHVDEIPQNMTIINYIRCVSPDCCYRLLLLLCLHTCVCLLRVCHECTMCPAAVAAAKALLLRSSTAALIMPAAVHDYHLVWRLACFHEQLCRVGWLRQCVGSLQGGG